MGPLQGQGPVRALSIPPVPVPGDTCVPCPSRDCAQPCPEGEQGRGDGAGCHCHPELSLWLVAAPQHRSRQARVSSVQGTGGGTGRVGETEARALGTLGARDRGLGPGIGFGDWGWGQGLVVGTKKLRIWGTRDWGTESGEMELRTKNRTLGVSDKRPGTQDREFGTGDPQSRAWIPPTPGGDMEGRGQDP